MRVSTDSDEHVAARVRDESEALMLTDAPSGDDLPLAVFQAHAGGLRPGGLARWPTLDLCFKDDYLRYWRSNEGRVLPKEDDGCTPPQT